MDGKGLGLGLGILSEGHCETGTEAVVAFIAAVRNDDSALLAGWLRPTSTMLMAGERGDPIPRVLIVFGTAILRTSGSTDWLD